ncbi:MAG: CRTAC1 family protein [Armatimonadetes bacterium]|nr:CRTAC1 family protein [Armatimonadota bacterium]
MPFFPPIKRLAAVLGAWCLALGLMAVLGGCRPAAPRPATPPPPASPITFTDVAEQAGLRYHWPVPGHRPLNILQTIGNGCAFLDYDNSGHLSLLLVGPNLALYKGDGRGHFTDVTHRSGLDRFHGHFLGVAVGDYDGDGYDDIYVSGYRAGLLLHNDGGKSFRDVTRQAGLTPQPWGTSCAFVESVPGSGRLDLFVCNYADFGPDPKKYQQFCFARGLRTSCGPRFYSPAKDVFYRNDGHGHFTDATGVSGMRPIINGKGLGVACAPLDGTRRPYIAVADDEVASDLLRAAGSGSPARYVNIGGQAGIALDGKGSIHGGMGTDWGDYDNDGKLDLIVATYQNETKSLYHNDGQALFSDQAEQAGLGPAFPLVAFGVKWADFDNDGWLDLMLANGHTQDNIHDIDASTTYRQPTQLFRNDHARFTDLSDTAGPALQRPLVGRGLAVGDFDNDGRVDALVVDSEGAPLLLRNDSPRPGHWLSLQLVGVRSNRDGYGALVTVRTPGLTQTRLCQADGSYLSSSDKRVHVGLGAAMSAQSVTVKWPSGRVDAFRGVPADRFYTLREGGKLLPAPH